MADLYRFELLSELIHSYSICSAALLTRGDKSRQNKQRSTASCSNWKLRYKGCQLAGYLLVLAVSQWYSDINQ